MAKFISIMRWQGEANEQIDIPIFETIWITKMPYLYISVRYTSSRITIYKYRKLYIAYIGHNFI